MQDATMPKEKKAVVLSSGGLDSTTMMALVWSEGYEIYSLSFRYGQRHAQEIAAAQRVAQVYEAKKHMIIDIGLGSIGGSALTDDVDVPKARTQEEIRKGVPVTYVPARNTIFLSYALAWAEVVGSWDIFIGVNAIDYSGYPDCRPEYIEAFQQMANLATKAAVEGKRSVRIRAPFINMSKPEIIKKGIQLGVDYGITHSCYDPGPGGRACGECDSCLIRRKGFQDAGIQDPIGYVTSDHIEEKSRV